MKPWPVKKVANELLPSEVVHLRELQAALLDTQPSGERAFIYGLALMLICFLLWAAFFKLDEVTHGTAKVIASIGDQSIQSLEGGILGKLYVREGDRVEAGQVLVEVDPTKANASYQEGVSKMLALSANVARLRAEAFDRGLSFPPELKKQPELIKNETQAYRARRQALEQSVTELQHSLELAQREVEMSEPLVRRGLISDIELLRMKRQVNEFRLQISEKNNKYRADANAELVAKESELAQTRENTLGRQDVAERTSIKSPVRGIVKDIRINTVGGVIQPGAVILEVVPLDDRLLVEAKVKPQDVAFLREGMPAFVKITAYDFSIYGGLEGTVVHISPDTLHEESHLAVANTGEENFYRVLVRTQESELRKAGKSLPIMPGMTGSVDIRTGGKTVLDYLLKPVFKAKEALQER